MGLVCTVRLHRLCNQGCTFCTLRDSVPQALPTPQVLSELASARAGGATIARFTGGEPTLDRRLPGLVRRARDLGYQHVEIETNAVLLTYPAVLGALVEAGLDRAWVTLHAADDALNDQVTRDEGGAARTWAGARALAAAGVTIGLCTPVLPGTVASLAALIDRAAELPTLDAVRFYAVTDRGEAALSALEAGLGKAAARCRKHRLDHRFESAYCPPPCAFSERFVRVHSPLFASLRADPGGTDDPRVRVAACAACGIADRCAGFPSRYVAARPGDLPGAPPGEEAVAAIRGQLGGVDRGARNQVRHVQMDDPGGDKPNVRLIWACNQRCRFCWVDFDWTPPTRERVLAQLGELAARGARAVSLTGGEPTLVPWLPDAVGLAAALGFERIELQTNGTHLTDALVQRLVDAGLTDVLVSLHSHVPEVADAITQSPGDAVRTVAGVDRLVGTTLLLEVNHVITRRNLATTVSFVDFVHGRWGGRVKITWSVAAPITEASQRYDDSIVPFDEAGPVLREALERCVALGVPFGGQDSTCGVPPCVLGGDPRFVTRGFEPGHEDSGSFVFPEACGGCSHRGICRGLQRSYVATFGDRGIRPLIDPPALTRPDGAARLPVQLAASSKRTVQATGSSVRAEESE
ncbi:MAG: hypothetical protein AMXMBFR64_18090 [Myxococcales bacterium]